MATPTYTTYRQQPQTYSNNLRTSAQQQTNAWYPNRTTSYTQPQTSQYGNTQPYTTDMGRGGAQPIAPRYEYSPMPLPGTTIDREQSSYYNPTMPSYQQGAPYTPAVANQFSYYQGLEPQTLQVNDEREAALQSVQANVPIWQLQQNAYQYSQDYNEANRRWQEQFNYQQGLDRYNMDLAAQQQRMAEWQAQQAASQWSQDFNRQTGNDQWQQGFSQQQFGLQDYATREQLAQQAAQNQWQQQYQQGQLDTGNRQLDIQQQLGLGNLDIQRQANDINNAYNQGRLSNEQRQIALAELAQSQQYGLQQQAFAQQQAEQGRRFGLDERTQAALETYRGQQLAQELAMAREQMAAQRELGLMQAYGRNQAPNVRWMRSA